MQSNRADSSLLTKPGAIIFWLVLCIVCVLFEKTGIAIFLGFVFVLSLTSFLWARYALKDVDCKLTIDRIGMFPGQLFFVKRSVQNKKTLPLLWAEIRESCTLEDCASPLADVIVKEEIYTGETEKELHSIYERLYTLSLIKWRQSVFFKDEWQATRRGIVEIESTMLRSGDGFGLCAESKIFELSPRPRIVVYPNLVPTSVAGILNDVWDMRSEKDGYLKDRTIIKSVRDYMPGDAARDINMRLMARGQSMKTNIFETVTPDTILFVLDTGSFRQSSQSIFERALSVTASLIDELTKRGIGISLMTPASKWFAETCTLPSSLESDKYHMLELLAAVSQEDEDFSPNIPMPILELGRVYIVCSNAKNLTIPLGTFSFPEHKQLCLEAEDTVTEGNAFDSASINIIRARKLFDFERAV